VEWRREVAADMAAEGVAWGSEVSERVRKKKDDASCYVRVLCRVPAIWHSIKIFLILKYTLSSVHDPALGKAFFTECPPADTWQRLIYFLNLPLPSVSP
jgi:hypothetical protein